MMMTSRPRFPLYIPSKSRAGSALTPRLLDRLGVPYRIIVEEQQRENYEQHFPPEKLLTLDPHFQETYETCDDLGASKSLGPGPARNFAWAHALSEGHNWHWVMDDNIRYFIRFHKNVKVGVGDGTIFHAMETFVLRYTNIAMAGPNYDMFVPARNKRPPFITGTRIYSCNLIRNDVQQRWRGRYNEDTILSVDLLKAGWQTVQFNAFLQHKTRTQVMGGGNTAEFYTTEGTLPKSQMLADVHPDVAKVTYRFGRVHHHVDYSRWLGGKLTRRDDHDPTAEPEYRMKVKATGAKRHTAYKDNHPPSWLTDGTT